MLSSVQHERSAVPSRSSTEGRPEARLQTEYRISHGKKRQRERFRTTHYYSQFWLDVAAGRRIIGAPKSEEESELAEVETSEFPAQRKAGRTNGLVNAHDSTANGGRAEALVHPVAEPPASPEEFIEPDVDKVDQTTDEAVEPTSEDVGLADTDIPDVNLDDGDEEDEEFSEEDEDEEFSEEEEDEDWDGARRKKSKVVRPTKPSLKKPGRREPRRGNY